MSATDNAVRYLGNGAPANVIAAEARCRAWRPFAQHTDHERAAHATDRREVDAYEASLKPYDLPGADPMGDE